MINQKRLVNTFLELVKIDSPSGEEKKVAEYVADKLKIIGGKVESDSFGNIICKFDGVGVPIMLNSHLDTVEPGRKIKPHVIGNKILSDGTTILGGDDKAGVAIILEALTSLKEDKTKHAPIEAVFTVGEEEGLLGALNLDYAKIQSKRGITFDGDYNVANITTSAPGYGRVDATITGRSAHAGFEPEKGISAIKIAAEIIMQLKVGRIDEETTANIGMIQGGTARNAVPESAHLKAEIRSRSPEKLSLHTQHFEKVFENARIQYPEAKIELDIHNEFDPYHFDENHKVIEAAVRILKSMGLKPLLAPSGGGSDVNIFHKQGIETICVGAGYYEPHTTREYVAIPDLVTGAMFCEKLVLVD